MKYNLTSDESADYKRGLKIVLSATPPIDAPKHIFRTLLSRIPLTGHRLFQRPSNQKQIPGNPTPRPTRERTSIKRGHENPFHKSDSNTSGRWVNRSVLSRVQHWIYGVLAAGAVASVVSAAEPPLVELLPFGSEGVRTDSEIRTDGDLVLQAIFVDFSDAPQSPANPGPAVFDALWAKLTSNGELTSAYWRQGFKGKLTVNIEKRWQRMPQPRSFYFPSSGPQQWSKYIEHAGVLFGNGPFTANTIAFIVPAEGPEVPGLSASAHGSMLNNGIKRTVVVSPNQYSDSYRIKVHEIGHTFGSPDLYPSSGAEHLVGGYAMMADARGARDFHGWHLFRYGWLAQNRTKFLNKAGTYNIDLKKISNSLGEAMIVIPDPHQYAKLWVVEVGRDILKQDDYKQGKNNYLNREGQRLIVYTVEGAPAAPLREIRLAFRTNPPQPLEHLSTAWLDAVSYVAGQSMASGQAPGQAPFDLSVTSKTSDGFQIQITLPNNLSGGVYTRPQDRFSPDGNYVMRFKSDGNIVIYKTTPPPETYHWDAINSPSPKWFTAPILTQPFRFSYENGTIKRLNNMTGAVIDQYIIQANVSGPSYLGVNNSGAPEIFTFVQPAPPTLTSLNTPTGTTAGGTIVTLTGTGFTGATGVIFGGAPATNFSVINATTITCTTPGGSNPTNSLFTYVATPPTPTLTSVSPPGGSNAGGNTVTLTGTGAMQIGGNNASDVINVTGPLNLTGTVTVTFVGGYTGVAGHTFDLFNAGGAMSISAIPSLPSLPAGLVWNSATFATTGQLSITGSISFAQWAASVLGNPSATPTGDHDRDGLANGVEYALGLFPSQPGTVVPVIDLFTYGNGRSLRVRFTRPLDRTGVTLRVQASSDLLTWTDLAVSVNSAPFTGPGFLSENRTHPLADPGAVEVRDTLTTPANPRRMVRLRVEIAP